MEVIASICLGVWPMANVTPIGTILLVHKWPTYYNIYMAARVGISINNCTLVITLSTQLDVCLIEFLPVFSKCQLLIYFCTRLNYENIIHTIQMQHVAFMREICCSCLHLF